MDRGVSVRDVCLSGVCRPVKTSRGLYGVLSVQSKLAEVYIYGVRSVQSQEEDNESVNENDADLNKSLNKQRRHAVAAAPGEQRRSIASRSTYKDKGGKSSQNSRMQRQLCSW
ncbi:hypothetical protein NC652_019874 [Populus alba x Populus x berolinensis]|uniref:Uncharacterized protein n=1 Tax=Populus alba x Populus x berolinensis TaxID=444605 RepID=A0AAD6QJL8_9ROSI|nr:hypothetical protein NC652_019874 [Populus alba x Populus x berolinensis]KAJ6991646.1 hypothetical protein NC653_019730 [Populus alba x Populus x berolinensis]